MVTTRTRVVIGVVLLLAITIAPAAGWALTRAGRIDRPTPVPTPVAAAPTTASAAPTATATPTPASTPTTAPTASPTAGPPPLLQATATAPARFVEAPGLAWDAGAVVSKPADFFRIPCPGVEGGLAYTVSTPAAMQCVAEAVTAARGSPQAVAFLRQYQVFLESFEEHGRVDVGATAAAWQNMGRSEPIFLNSTPAMLPMAWLLPGEGPTTAQAWLSQPAYVSALAGASALVWSEYATIAEQPGAAGGGQRFLVAYPLRTCRACANLATLRVVYRFDTSGRYQGYELLAPGPPGS